MPPIPLRYLLALSILLAAGCTVAIAVLIAVSQASFAKAHDDTVAAAESVGVATARGHISAAAEVLLQRMTRTELCANASVFLVGDLTATPQDATAALGTFNATLMLSYMSRVATRQDIYGGSFSAIYDNTSIQNVQAFTDRMRSKDELALAWTNPSTGLNEVLPFAVDESNTHARITSLTPKYTFDALSFMLVQGWTAAAWFKQVWAAGDGNIFWSLVYNRGWTVQEAPVQVRYASQSFDDSYTLGPMVSRIVSASTATHLFILDSDGAVITSSSQRYEEWFYDCQTSAPTTDDAKVCISHPLKDLGTRIDPAFTILGAFAMDAVAGFMGYIYGTADAPAGTSTLLISNMSDARYISTTEYMAFFDAAGNVLEGAGGTVDSGKARFRVMVAPLRNGQGLDLFTVWVGPVPPQPAATDYSALFGILGGVVGVSLIINIVFLLGLLTPIRRTVAALSDVATLDIPALLAWAGVADANDVRDNRGEDFAGTPSSSASLSCGIGDGTMTEEGATLKAATTALSAAVLSFSRFMPCDIVRILLTTSAVADVDLKRVKLHILFVDIAGFTTMSEQLGDLYPHVLSVLLNRFFAGACSSVLATGGTVDKFIGDCVMAFWGAPVAHSHGATAALIAALRIAAIIGKGDSASLADASMPPGTTVASAVSALLTRHGGGGNNGNGIASGRIAPAFTPVPASRRRSDVVINLDGDGRSVTSQRSSRSRTCAETASLAASASAPDESVGGVSSDRSKTPSLTSGVQPQWARNTGLRLKNRHHGRRTKAGTQYDPATEATLMHIVQNADLTVRVGVNRGVALTGNTGCTERLSYTAVGDAVNTASRLEGFVKNMGRYCQIVASSGVVSEAHPAIVTRYIGPVRLAGKDDPIEIAQVLGVASVSQKVIDAVRAERAPAVAQLMREDAVKLMNHDDDDDGEGGGVNDHNDHAMNNGPDGLSVTPVPQIRDASLSESAGGIILAGTHAESDRDPGFISAFPSAAGIEGGDKNCAARRHSRADTAETKATSFFNAPVRSHDNDAAEAATIAAFVAEMRELLADDPIGVIHGCPIPAALLSAAPQEHGPDPFGFAGDVPAIHPAVRSFVQEGEWKPRRRSTKATLADGGADGNPLVYAPAAEDDGSPGAAIASASLGGTALRFVGKNANVASASVDREAAEAAGAWHRGLVLFDGDAHAANEALNAAARAYADATAAVRSAQVAARAVLPQQQMLVARLLHDAETAFAALPPIARATCPLAASLQAAQSATGVIECDRK